MLSMELWKGTLQQNASLRNVIACSGTELKVVRVPNSEVVRVTSSEVVRAAGAYCGWRLLRLAPIAAGAYCPQANYSLEILSQSQHPNHVTTSQSVRRLAVAATKETGCQTPSFSTSA
ncbi:hypothetical protein, partial [Acidaminobacter sp.]|uniref:hypothetical protein n=1 Tax=Acidaminobacter sp. TaxID=1872102 RepID=UPI0025BBB916